jgi:TPR repeat protein
VCLKQKSNWGKMYLYGRGTETNPQKALLLFEEAKADGSLTADRLIPKAQAKLGSTALKTNAIQGIQLLEQAAAQGNAQAMFDLGQAYEKGSGVSVNGSRASQYYEQSRQTKLLESRFLSRAIVPAGHACSQEH